MIQNNELILEILAEGGSISLYRKLILKSKSGEPLYQFFWSTNEMGLEDKDGLYSASGNNFQSLLELLEYLINKYTNMYDLYCDFIHGDYRVDIFNFIHNKIAEGKIKVDEMDSLNSWLEQLQISKEELITISEKSNEISNDKIVLKNTKNDIIYHIPTGFDSLDRFLSGWPKGSLIVIGGRPGMGKTAFVLSMVRNLILYYKLPVAIFSFEMTPNQIIKRFFSIETGIPIYKFQKNKLSGTELDLFHKKMDIILDAPIYIDDSNGLSIFELLYKARKMKFKFNIGLIIIDYLQMITAQTNNNTVSREQEVLKILHSLKSLAKELNIPIIVLSQLSRKVEDRVDKLGHKRPQLSDLRNFKAIEQISDIIGFIYRPEYYKIEQWEDKTSTVDQSSFIIAKHINGQTGCVRFNFNSECGHFTELDTK